MKGVIDLFKTTSTSLPSRKVVLFLLVIISKSPVPSKYFKPTEAQGDLKKVNWYFIL